MGDTFAEMFQAKRSLTFVASVVGSLVIIVGALTAIDGRYAHASELEQMQKSEQAYHEESKVSQRMSIDTLRQQQIEDKLFELRLNPHPSQVDKAITQRYTDQLNEVNSRLNAREKAPQ
jgi:hypothetical protein